MTQVLEVTTTAPTQDVAQRMAESAITAGLAAGGQVSGPVSGFTWQRGECLQTREWTVRLRTCAGRYDELESHLITAHGAAAVVGAPLERVSAAYAAHVGEATARFKPAYAQVSVAAHAAGDGFESL